MKELMPQGGPPEEARTFARSNDRPQLLFSNRMTLLYRMDDSKWSFGKNIILPFEKI